MLLPEQVYGFLTVCLHPGCHRLLVLSMSFALTLPWVSISMRSPSLYLQPGSFLCSEARFPSPCALDHSHKLTREPEIYLLLYPPSQTLSPPILPVSAAPPGTLLSNPLKRMLRITLRRLPHSRAGTRASHTIPHAHLSQLRAESSQHLMRCITK